jgi:hypothetical protein
MVYLIQAMYMRRSDDNLPWLQAALLAGSGRSLWDVSQR